MRNKVTRLTTRPNRLTKKYLADRQLLYLSVCLSVCHSLYDFAMLLRLVSPISPGRKTAPGTVPATAGQDRTGQDRTGRTAGDRRDRPDVVHHIPALPAQEVMKNRPRTPSRVRSRSPTTRRPVSVYRPETVMNEWPISAHVAQTANVT